MPHLILADAAAVVTPASRYAPQRGKTMRDLSILKNGSVAIDVGSGKITAIGPWKKIKTPKAMVIDAKNNLILPGFVDSHTHPVYAGSRVDEFALRAQGVSYLEILSRGGGI